MKIYTDLEHSYARIITSKFDDSTSPQGVVKVFSPLGTMVEVYDEGATHNLCSNNKFIYSLDGYEYKHSNNMIKAEFLAYTETWSDLLQLVTDDVDCRKHILNLRKYIALSYAIEVAEIQTRRETFIHAEAICMSLNAIDSCNESLK
ncbi:MAG: hypothetical protein Q7K57_52305 [Burkholderiaceae bacterium]|nr:hypothetical protein [Burkholderiaceae bacterium]